MKIAVLYGGSSEEAKLSAEGAEYVRRALIELGYDTAGIEYDMECYERLRKEQPDAVFLCVQGKGHGDGTAQALCEHLHIPYTGSPLEGAAIINDKIICKEIALAHGIRTPKFFTLTKADYHNIDAEGCFEDKMADQKMEFPVIVKAPSQGGSYGITLLESMEDFENIAPIFEYDEVLLAEEYIDGEDRTVGLLEKDGVLEAFPVIEGKVMKRDGGIMVDVAADVVQGEAAGSREALLEMQQSAKTLFTACHARDYARADFMLGKDGRAYFIEINAVPGMKRGNQSLYPVGAQEFGIDYNTLVSTIVRNAVSRRLDAWR